MRYLIVLVLLAGCASNEVWYDISTGRQSSPEAFEDRWRSTHDVTGTIPKEALQRPR